MSVVTTCRLCACDLFEAADFDACVCGHMRADHNVAETGTRLDHSDVAKSRAIAWWNPGAAYAYAERTGTALLIGLANIVAMVLVVTSLGGLTGDDNPGALVAVWTLLVAAFMIGHVQWIVRRRARGIVGGDGKLVAALTLGPMAFGLIMLLLSQF